MDVLLAFLLRLACGLAAGMGIVSPRQVTYGYYRNNLYVILGCNVLAGLAAWRLHTGAWGWCVAGAALSYAGAVCWLYEKPKAGRLALWLVAAVALAGSWAAQRPWLVAGTAHFGTQPRRAEMLHHVLRWCDAPLGSVVAGGSVAAMLLGHWYLNAPGMQLAPLRRLLRWLLLCVAMRAATSAISAVAVSQAGMPASDAWLLALRWGAGIVGVIALVVMSGRSLAVPNTQSATGILYVAVIGAFAGELLALLLATRYPLAL